MATTRHGTNHMTLYGIMTAEPMFDHSLRGRDYYSAIINVTRLSNTVDMIPVIIPDDLIDRDKVYSNTALKIDGYFRSRNFMGEDGKHHTALYMYATAIETIAEISEDVPTNQIFIRGYICKKPVFRTTPAGRQITDVIIAIPRPTNGSDYIPCILWNDQARIMKSLEVGMGVALLGRVQSREYVNKKEEQHTAYEVSVSRITDTMPKNNVRVDEKETKHVTQPETGK